MCCYREIIAISISFQLKSVGKALIADMRGNLVAMIRSGAFCTTISASIVAAALIRNFQDEVAKNSGGTL